MKSNWMIIAKQRHLKIYVTLCMTILLVGFGGFVALAKLREPPEEVVQGERPLQMDRTERSL